MEDAEIHATAPGSSRVAWRLGERAVDFLPHGVTVAADRGGDAGPEIGRRRAVPVEGADQRFDDPGLGAPPPGVPYSDPSPHRIGDDDQRAVRSQGQGEDSGAG